MGSAVVEGGEREEREEVLLRPPLMMLAPTVAGGREGELAAKLQKRHGLSPKNLNPFASNTSAKTCSEPASSRALASAEWASLFHHQAHPHAHVTHKSPLNAFI